MFIILYTKTIDLLALNNTYYIYMKSYKVETTDLAEKVYNSIKEMILNRKLVPGQKLVQEDMAEQLGVSRTPILSAFSKLEKEWLVKSLPRRGYYINEMGIDEKLSLFDIRLRLEPLGARKAAELGSGKEKQELMNMIISTPEIIFHEDFTLFNKHDYEFHRKIMSMSRNSMLYMMLSSYNIISLSNQNAEDINYSISIAGHKLIAEAIFSSNPEKTEKIMEEHIRKGLERLTSSIKS